MCLIYWRSQFAASATGGRHAMKELIPQERIEHRIFVIRGQKVMLDRDLAKLYGVETKYLKRQVRRNLDLQGN